MSADRYRQRVAEIVADETARLSDEHSEGMPSWHDIRGAVIARILAECADDLPDPQALLADYAGAAADKADKAARDRSAKELRQPPLDPNDFLSTIWDTDGGRRSTGLSTPTDLTENSKAFWDKANRYADAARRREKLNSQRAGEIIDGGHRRFRDAVQAGDCPPIEDDDDPDES